MLIKAIISLTGATLKLSLITFLALFIGVGGGFGGMSPFYRSGSNFPLSLLFLYLNNIAPIIFALRMHNPLGYASSISNA